MAKKSRRARGTGSIFKDERRGVWVGRKPLQPAKGPSGKSYTRYQEVSAPTQGEVVRRLEELQPPAPSITVADWGLRWLNTLSVRPLTLESYTRSLTARIIPALGHIPVAAVTTHHVELAIKEWGNGLAPNSVRTTIAHLRILFSAAVRAELIDRNPVSSARKPRAKKVETVPYTAAELRRIIAACQKPPACAVAVLAATGMRKGELVALDIEDFDRKTGTLSITKGFVRGHGIGPPKSPHSERTIEVPSQAIPAIIAAVGRRMSGPLFVADGERQTYGAVDHQWRLCCKRLGLTYQRQHALRHSIGSLLNANGIGIGDLAKFLGDAPETVVKVYVHATEIRPVETLNRLLRGR